jgi:hypothetical protein
LRQQIGNAFGYRHPNSPQGLITGLDNRMSQQA